MLKSFKKYNEKKAGLSLLGKVIATGSESLKVHLDIYGKQDKATAYWFNYRPITGNVMHTMSQIGKQ